MPLIVETLKRLFCSSHEISALEAESGKIFRMSGICVVTRVYLTTSILFAVFGCFML